MEKKKGAHDGKALPSASAAPEELNPTAGAKAQASGKNEPKASKDEAKYAAASQAQGSQVQQAASTRVSKKDKNAKLEKSTMDTRAAASAASNQNNQKGTQENSANPKASSGHQRNGHHAGANQGAVAGQVPRS